MDWSIDCLIESNSVAAYLYPGEFRPVHMECQVLAHSDSEVVDHHVLHAT